MTALAATPTTRALPWVHRLRAHGDRVALHTPDGPVTYAGLAARVGEAAVHLAGPRRLVQVEGRSTLASVVALLGAQAAGHVVLLGAPGSPAAALREAYDPDVVVDAAGGVDVRRAESAHVLHPDLALLMSTSGSTGSPRLVRLSAENLAANAAQIDAALSIRADDCAALTLPLTYCYGLSVLHTHLAAGASVLLTGLSVVDECFWREAEDAGVTTLPGVPHTFDLLDRLGAEGTLARLPRLRSLTQAGGRMAPDRVRDLAALGERQGFGLCVMYGQCEATARIACLPPELAAEHPDAVGLPVPGVGVEVDDGEIVVRGPNVMLGYAEGPADLALGRTVDALRTGDLGEVGPDGLIRVVGRRARFVKVLGHRVDLDALERRLRDLGETALVGGRDGLVAVAAEGVPSAPARERVRRATARAAGVPLDAVRVATVDALPMLANGKPDHAGVLGIVDVAASAVDTAEVAEAPHAVADLYARLLDRPVGPDDTFVTLGGDSLSYVEVSVGLERLLGDLPPSWHVTPVAQLERARAATATTTAPDGATAAARRPRWQAMETGIWLRALAIVLIVGTHADLFTLQGTANALLVLAGFQAARFQLADPDRRARSRRLLVSAAKVAAPTVVVIAVAHLAWGMYEPRNLVLLNWALGEDALGPPLRFWFVEAIVLALVVVAALVRLPAVQRLDARYPLGLPLALSVLAWGLLRWPVLPLPVPHMHGSALVVLHLVLLGWALARARTTLHRWLLSGVVLGMVMTFSFNEARDALTAAVVLVLLWRPVTRVPSAVVPLVQVLAAASLYVYVVHWQLLEVLWPLDVPLLATAGSLALGVAYWWLWTGPVTRAARRVRGLVRSAAPAG
ncbi:non-ribosomal peptide synthetase [Phycicoccus sp. BSK3Z-2]|uniref:Non-ribosomal peptide synthetase n=1 Tax=Phycicoccus avicenniae TaxID=2828860 RepID=A0A941DBS9_9MICO|nr:non-ribosomal peptide synthetase [Phycicoccus avicenniae]MBR7744783.1 non-ribosomal peptide synthetase [Phycicoccus avicenniae]